MRLLDSLEAQQVSGGQATSLWNGGYYIEAAGGGADTGVELRRTADGSGGGLTYYDMDRNGVLSKGDVVYQPPVGSQSNTVDWGEVLRDGMWGALEGGTTGAIAGGVVGGLVGGPPGAATGFFFGGAGGGLGGLIYYSWESYAEQSGLKPE